MNKPSTFAERLNAAVRAAPTAAQRYDHRVNREPPTNESPVNWYPLKQILIVTEVTCLSCKRTHSYPQVEPLIEYINTTQPSTKWSTPKRLHPTLTLDRLPREIRITKRAASACHECFIAPAAPQALDS